jgi:hypothetical protein
MVEMEKPRGVQQYDEEPVNVLLNITILITIMVVLVTLALVLLALTGPAIGNVFSNLVQPL